MTTTQSPSSLSSLPLNCIYRNLRPKTQKDALAIIQAWSSEQKLTDWTRPDLIRPVAEFSLNLYKIMVSRVISSMESLAAPKREQKLSSSSSHSSYHILTNLKFSMKRLGSQQIDCPNLTLAERTQWIMLQYTLASIKLIQKEESAFCFSLVSEFLQIHQSMKNKAGPSTSPLLELNMDYLRACYMILGARLRDDHFQNYISDTLTFWGISGPENVTMFKEENTAPMVLSSAPKIFNTLSSDQQTEIREKKIRTIPSHLLKQHWLYDHEQDYKFRCIQLINIFACQAPYKAAHELLHGIDQDTQSSYRFVEYGDTGVPNKGVSHKGVPHKGVPPLTLPSQKTETTRVGDEKKKELVISTTKSVVDPSDKKPVVVALNTGTEYAKAKEVICMVLADANLTRQLCPEYEISSSNTQVAPSIAGEDCKAPESLVASSYDPEICKLIESCRDRYLWLRSVLLFDMTKYHQDAFEDIAVDTVKKLKHLNMALDCAYQCCRTLFIVWYRSIFVKREGGQGISGIYVIMLASVIKIYIALRDENINNIRIAISYNRHLRELLPETVIKLWSDETQDKELLVDIGRQSAYSNVELV